MNYRHPGKAFLARHGMIQREEDIFRYVDFLRRESGLGDQPPIDLEVIYRHFGMPTPIPAPLDEQQGILVDSNTGIILIKEDDSLVRQRFTEGHELMELLFDAIAESQEKSALPSWSEAHKEKLCDRGAADLLMPRSSFIPRLYELGLSIQTARSLAEMYQTSLMSTLVRMIEQGEGNCALVAWHQSLKPTEMRKTTVKSAKKLRIWWRMQTPDWTGGFIPKDKSISGNSRILAAYELEQSQSGQERINLGWGSIDCEVEAVPIVLSDRTYVLSLLKHCATDGRDSDQSAPTQTYYPD
jgi:IrrE N-terminal-like domain